MTYRPQDTILTALNTGTGITKFDGFEIGADDTEFNIGDVEGYIVDNTNDVDNTTITKVVRSATSGEVTPFLNTDNVSFVGINLSGGIVYKTSPFTNEEHRTTLDLGIIAHTGQTVVDVVVDRPNILQSPISQVQDYIRALQTVNSSGNKYSANGANLNIDRSAGTLVGTGLAFSGGISKLDNPNELSLSLESPVANMLYVFQDDTNFPISGNFLDPNIIETSPGVSGVVANNQFTIQYLVMFSEGRTNIQIGQTEYATLQAAKDAIENEIYVVAPVISAAAIIVAAIVLKKGTIDLTNTSEVFIKNFGKLGGNI